MDVLKLQFLNISWSDSTDEGMRALAIGFLQLQSLDISECRNITDKGRKIAMRINRNR